MPQRETISHGRVQLADFSLASFGDSTAPNAIIGPSEELKSSEPFGPQRPLPWSPQRPEPLGLVPQSKWRQVASDKDRAPWEGTAVKRKRAEENESYLLFLILLTIGLIVMFRCWDQVRPKLSWISRVLDRVKSTKTTVDPFATLPMEFVDPALADTVIVFKPTPLSDDRLMESWAGEAEGTTPNRSRRSELRRRIELLRVRLELMRSDQHRVEQELFDLLDELENEG
jgi:hypothetical protein